MQIVPDLKADTAIKVVKEQLSYQSDIQSDDSTTYKKLNEVVQVASGTGDQAGRSSESTSVGTYLHRQRKFMI